MHAQIQKADDDQHTTMSACSAAVGMLCDFGMPHKKGTQKQRPTGFRSLWRTPCGPAAPVVPDTVCGRPQQADSPVDAAWLTGSPVNYAQHAVGHPQWEVNSCKGCSTCWAKPAQGLVLPPVAASRRPRRPAASSIRPPPQQQQHRRAGPVQQTRFTAGPV